MARLRFVGRASRARNQLQKREICETEAVVQDNVEVHEDRNSQLIANIQRGLKLFLTLAGQPDEDDFNGFTARDISLLVTRIESVSLLRQQLLKASHVDKRRCSSDKVEFVGFNVRDIRQLEKRISAVDALYKQIKESNIPSEWESPKHKNIRDVNRENYFNSAFNSPFASPSSLSQSSHSKPSMKGSIKVRLLLGAQSVKDLLGSSKRPEKKVAQHRSVSSSSEISDSEAEDCEQLSSSEGSESESRYHVASKVRGRPKLKVPLRPLPLAKSSAVIAKARQLVTKAKVRETKNKAVESAKTASPAVTKPYTPRWHGQIRLPTQSSHSSRIITINKRFLDDSFSTIGQMSKKVKLEDVSAGLTGSNTSCSELVDEVTGKSSGESKGVLKENCAIAARGRQARTARAAGMQMQSDVVMTSSAEKLTARSVGKMKVKSKNILKENRVIAAGGRPGKTRHLAQDQQSSAATEPLSVLCSKAIVDKAKRIKSRTVIKSVKKSSYVVKGSRQDASDDEGLQQKWPLLTPAKDLPIMDACNICASLYKVSRHYLASVPVCRSCARFYQQYCMSLTKTPRNCECRFDNNCELKIRGANASADMDVKLLCAGCRLEKCLEIFPAPKMFLQCRSDGTFRSGKKPVLSKTMGKFDMRIEMKQSKLGTSKRSSAKALSDTSGEKLASGADKKLTDVTPNKQERNFSVKCDSQDDKDNDTRRRSCRKLPSLEDQAEAEPTAKSPSLRQRRKSELSIADTSAHVLTGAEKLNSKNLISDSRSRPHRLTKNASLMNSSLSSDLCDPVVLLSQAKLTPELSKSKQKKAIVETDLNKLFEDEDLMNFAAAVDRSLEQAIVDPLDILNNTERFQRIEADDADSSHPGDGLISETGASDMKGSGPRIKHVCRRAAVALGKPVAKFPVASSYNLSALPSLEKRHVLEGDDEDMAFCGPDSDLTRASLRTGDSKFDTSASSSTSVEKEKEHADSDDEWQECSKKRRKKTLKHWSLDTDIEPKQRRRHIRCGQCGPCSRPNCGECESCRDMPKFGGPGVLKQGCRARICDKPVLKNSSLSKPVLAQRIARSMKSAIKLKKAVGIGDNSMEKSEDRLVRRVSADMDDDQDFTDVPRVYTEVAGKRRRLGGFHPYRSMLSGGLGSKIYSGLLSARSRPALLTKKLSKSDFARKKLKGASKFDKLARGNALRDIQDNMLPPGPHNVDLDEQGSPKVPNLKSLTSFADESRDEHPATDSSSLPTSQNDQLMHKKRGKQGRKFGGERGRSLLPSVPSSSSLTSLDSAATDEGKPGQPNRPKQYSEKTGPAVKFNPFQSPALQAAESVRRLIKADHKENMDLDDAWTHGVALISSSPICLRAICRLCGSLGQEPLLFCNVCCEPYHSFCLEESQRPIEGHADIWCCQKCQYCCVCYGQNNLIQCDKCQGSYHAHCIGTNYPTTRTRKKIWVCHKCVRCQSCGATTPGPDPNDQWVCDFSLCTACGQLMQKGNFCPICHKCYVDDDWDSQMIQCSDCQQWVHSSCEQLTDEMYQIVTHMPEDIDFICRVCCGNRPSRWHLMVRQEMHNGMFNVIDSLMASKSSKRLQPLIIPAQVFHRPGSSQRDQSGAFQEPTSAVSRSADNHASSADRLLKPDNCTSGSSNWGSVNSATNSGINIPSLVSSQSADYDILNSSDIESLDASLAAPRTAAVSESLQQPFSNLLASEATREPSSVPAQELIDPDSTYPTNLDEVQDKLDGDEYKSVDEFVRDIIRILVFNSDKVGDNIESQKAACTIRDAFIKKMSKQFPWFDIQNSKIWTSKLFEKSAVQSDSALLENSVAPPSLDHIYARWTHRSELPAPIQTSLFKQPCFGDARTAAGTGNRTKSASGPLSGVITKSDGDSRHCTLCWVYGDCEDDDAGRLLYAGQDDWVHVNCALWSAEVYEEGDGSLQAVHAALARGRKLRCDACAKPGATVGCCYDGCYANYHFMCSRRNRCLFLESKKVYCRLHRSASDGEVMEDGSFAVLRRTWVDVDSNRSLKRPWNQGLEPSAVNILKGSLSVDSIGTLSRLSDSKTNLLPVGYSVSRLFWSTVDPRRRSIYTCRIVEVVPKFSAAPPVIMKEQTISHDENDANYDPALSAKYLSAGRRRLSTDTLSASDDENLSDADSRSTASVESADVSCRTKPDAAGKVCNEERLGHPPANVSCMRREQHSVERSSVALSTAHTVFSLNRSQSRDSSGSPASTERTSSDEMNGELGGLSKSTLKLLRIQPKLQEKDSSMSQHAAVDHSGDDLLLSMAKRLNEAAAKSGSSRQPTSTIHRYPSSKPIPSVGGLQLSRSIPASTTMTNGSFDSRVAAADYGPPELPLRVQQVPNKKTPERIYAHLMQTDGAADETDSDVEESNDYRLLAEFSADDDSTSQPRPAENVLTKKPISTGIVTVPTSGDPSSVPSESSRGGDCPGAATSQVVDNESGACRLAYDSSSVQVVTNAVDVEKRSAVGVDKSSNDYVLPLALNGPSAAATTLHALSPGVAHDMHGAIDASDVPLSDTVVSPVLNKSSNEPIDISKLLADIVGKTCSSEIQSSNTRSGIVTSSIITSGNRKLNCIRILPTSTSEQKTVASGAVWGQQIAGQLAASGVDAANATTVQCQAFPVGPRISIQRVPNIQQGAGAQLVNSNHGSVPFQLSAASVVNCTPSNLAARSRAIIIRAAPSRPANSQISSNPVIISPSSAASQRLSVSSIPSVWSSCQQVTSPTANVFEVSSSLKHQQNAAGIETKTEREEHLSSMSRLQQFISLKAARSASEQNNVATVQTSSNPSHFNQSSSNNLSSCQPSVSTCSNVGYVEPRKIAPRPGCEAADQLVNNKYVSGILDPLSRNFELASDGEQQSSNKASSRILADSNSSNEEAKNRDNRSKHSSARHSKQGVHYWDARGSQLRVTGPGPDNEDEISDSPLLAMFKMEERRRQNGNYLTVQQNKRHLVFEITSDDGFSIQADSLKNAWRAVTDKVQDARLSAGMKPISFTALNGLEMCGLTHPSVIYLIEQLPGAHRCQQYDFKFHRDRLDYLAAAEDDEDELVETIHGCCRAEPFTTRKHRDMFAFLLSRYRIPPKDDQAVEAEANNMFTNSSQRRTTSLDLPMAMRFRALPRFAREAIGVYPSPIHGRGLFCRRAIDEGEMIVEYSGELIRSILCDQRERAYEAKDIGCYMFRQDRDYIIDSTVMGNQARFINHSCDPNCYSKVILVDGRRHIVIFALRAIRRGEELTYDYKFPIENDKIPCTCGTRRCRKYLN